MTATIPLPGKAGVRGGGREGRAHLQQHRRHQRPSSPSTRPRTRSSTPGRSCPARKPLAWLSTPANHRLFTVSSNSLMVMLDNTTGKVAQHAAHRPRRGRRRLRPGHGLRLRVEQRRHPRRWPRRRRASSCLVQKLATPAAHEDDDARPGDAPRSTRRRPVQGRRGGQDRKPRATDHGARFVQSDGVRARWRLARSMRSIQVVKRTICVAAALLCAGASVARPSPQAATPATARRPSPPR